MPAFSHDLLNLRRAFSKVSSFRIMTLVISSQTPFPAHKFINSFPNLLYDTNLTLSRDIYISFVFFAIGETLEMVLVNLLTEKCLRHLVYRACFNYNIQVVFLC
jgi:hypothetical protein